MTGTMNRRSLMARSAALAALSGLPAAAFAQSKTGITVRVDRDIAVLDPAFRAGPPEANILRCVMQRLIMQKPNSAETELDAASALTQISPTQIDFTLKPGQMFTGGFGEMTAEDVKFSFERFAVAAAPGKISPYKGDWTGLVGVTVKDKYSGSIMLSQPNAGLFAIALADVSGCIVSKVAIEKLGVEHNTKPVGSGPYEVVSVEKQRGATLKRNQGYSGPKPAFDDVKVSFISEPKTAELALRSRELDFAVLPPAVASPMKGVAGLAIEQSPGLAYVWLGINMQKPPFTDLRVRQAIRLALDVDQMLLAGFNGLVPRLNALIPAPILGNWKEAPVYKRNVAEAKRLLAEAGQSAIKARLTVLNQPANTTMALVARALLQEVGMTVEVDGQEGGTYWDSGKGDAGRNLDMFIMRFNGKLDPNFLMQWFVTDQIGVWNWQRFSDPEYDTLYRQSLAETDPAKRAQMVIQAQERMDKSAAFVWLTNDAAFIVHNDKVKPAYLPGALDWQLDRFTPA